MFVNEIKIRNCPGYIEKIEIITQFNHKKESSLLIVAVITQRRFKKRQTSVRKKERRLEWNGKGGHPRKTVGEWSRVGTVIL